MMYLHSLPQINRINRNDDIEHCQPCKLTHERPERIHLILLQGIIELIVPAVQPDKKIYPEKIQPDNKSQKSPGLPLMFTVPIPAEQVPKDVPCTPFPHVNHPKIKEIAPQKQDNPSIDLSVAYGNKNYQPIIFFISSSTVEIVPMPKFSTSTFATFGDKNAGSVGPR